MTCLTTKFDFNTGTPDNFMFYKYISQVHGVNKHGLEFHPT